MTLPNDPMMLFSAVNMLLRDEYASLEELCRREDVEMEDICSKLAAVGFEYSKENNKFW